MTNDRPFRLGLRRTSPKSTISVSHYLTEGKCTMAYNAKTGNYITPVGRISFPVLAEPKQINNTGEPKYQLTVLFDKAAQQTQDFKDMQAAVEKATTDKWGANRPRKVKSPFMTIDDLRNKVPAGYTEE